MATHAGQMLSHYRLLEKLGEGGMGVVWRALDTRLEREVAIKVLPQELASDPERLARFEREAKAVAALNHPNIVTVHSVEETAGVRFITMELVKGKTLTTLIPKNGLALGRLFELATALADAISTAHQQGITHRDLKPDNVMVGDDGRLKVLDFGLAKLREGTRAVEGSTQLPTATVTQEGKIIGTVSYMSPEQAEGKAVDHRSDIFSLGVVLYQMATGQRPFKGDTSVSIISSIMKDTPTSITDLNQTLPRHLGRIIRRCLAKRPDDRYNDTRDLVASLRDLQQETSAGGSQPAISGVGAEQSVATGERPLTVRRPGARWTLAVAAVVAVVVIGSVAVTLLLRQQAPPPAAVHRQVTFTGSAYHPEIAPDGQYVAYIMNAEEQGQTVLVRDLAGGNPLEIFRCEAVYFLRWLPNGTELLIYARDLETKNLEVSLVPRLGGAPRILPGFMRIAWAPDGRRYAGCNIYKKEITLVDMSTGDRTSVPLEDSFTWLQDIDWSPTDNFLAFLTADEERGSTIWTIPPEGGKQVKVVELSSAISSPRWSRDGRAVYYLTREGDASKLWKIRIDPRTGEPAADPSVVMSGLDTDGGVSVSRDGERLAYAKTAGHSNIWIATLHGDGRREPIGTEQLTSGTFRDRNATLSPDGRTVAFVRAHDIYTIPVEGGAVQQLTFTESNEDGPAWSPDGRWIAFGSDEGGASKVWRVRAQGGTARPFEKSSLSFDTSGTGQVIWSPGEDILYQRPGNRNFHILDPETGEETPLVKDDSVGWCFSARRSPDGSLIAVAWNRRERGVWLISVEDSSEVRIGNEYLYPVGWSADQAWVYAWDNRSSPNRVVRIPSSGGEEETVFQWPFEGKRGMCLLGPDETSWICTVGEISRDVWIVENFDPDLR